jgi:hypothetical protein
MKKKKRVKNGQSWKRLKKGVGEEGRMEVREEKKKGKRKRKRRKN